MHNHVEEELHKHLRNIEERAEIKDIMNFIAGRMGVDPDHCSGRDLMKLHAVMLSLLLQTTLNARITGMDTGNYTLLLMATSEAFINAACDEDNLNPAGPI